MCRLELEVCQHKGRSVAVDSIEKANEKSRSAPGHYC